MNVTVVHARGLLRLLRDRRGDARPFDRSLHAVGNRGFETEQHDARHQQVPPEILAPLLIFRRERAASAEAGIDRPGRPASAALQLLCVEHREVGFERIEIRRQTDGAAWFERPWTS